MKRYSRLSLAEREEGRWPRRGGDSRDFVTLPVPMRDAGSMASRGLAPWCPTGRLRGRVARAQGVADKRPFIGPPGHDRAFDSGLVLVADGSSD